MRERIEASKTAVGFKPPCPLPACNFFKVPGMITGRGETFSAAEIAGAGASAATLLCIVAGGREL